MSTPSLDVDAWIRDRLFDAVPVAIAVIDRNYDVVRANRTFERTFGAWKGLTGLGLLDANL